MHLEVSRLSTAHSVSQAMAGSQQESDGFQRPANHTYHVHTEQDKYAEPPKIFKFTFKEIASYVQFPQRHTVLSLFSSRKTLARSLLFATIKPRSIQNLSRYHCTGMDSRWFGLRLKFFTAAITSHSHKCVSQGHHQRVKKELAGLSCKQRKRAYKHETGLLDCSWPCYLFKNIVQILWGCF